MTDPNQTDGASPDEFADGDDAVIGQAFKWSLVVIALIAAVVTSLVLSGGGDEREEVVKDKDVGEIESVETDEEVLPVVRFTDVTASAGIDYVHENGATDEKLLPETMGGGAAFLDYDGDGDQDLFFVGGRRWPHDEAGSTAGRTPGNRLYQNDGRGGFTDVTAAAGIAGDTFGMGVAVGDIDGDGDVDLVTTGVGVGGFANRMWRNDGGTFVDVTEASGVGGSSDAWTTSAGFFDMDGDEDLDLFVCHYVRWSRSIDQDLAYTLNGDDRAYGPPMNYGGAYSSLYRNEGDGTFTDVSQAAGIHITNPATDAPMGKALGVAFLDADADGDQDIFVANDTVQNHLFENDGSGVFTEVGSRTGFGYDRNGGATGAMGIDIGDFRGDGAFGVCIGNFANEMSSLYVKKPKRLRFTDDAALEGVGAPSRLRLSFGMFFFDYDLDGRLDLLQVNGHLEESIHEVQSSQHYLQPPQLFWNQGADARSCFVEVPPDTAGDLNLDLAGRGSAFADIDADGDLDVVLAQVGRAPLLLRNDQELGRHWLRIRLRQDGPNPSALGASIEVAAGGRTLRRNVTRTRSYLSQSEPIATFGLGEADRVESITVTWPDGATQSVTPSGVDQRIEVQRER